MSHTQSRVQMRTGLRGPAGGGLFPFGFRPAPRQTPSSATAALCANRTPPCPSAATSAPQGETLRETEISAAVGEREAEEELLPPRAARSPQASRWQRGTVSAERLAGNKPVFVQDPWQREHRARH